MPVTPGIGRTRRAVESEVRSEMRVDCRRQKAENVLESMAVVYARSDGFQRLVSMPAGSVLHINRRRIAAVDPIDMQSREARSCAERAKNALDALERSGRIERVCPGAYIVK